MLVDSEFLQRDIVFDAPLDEALFSTDPPAGYSDLESVPGKKDEPQGL